VARSTAEITPAILRARYDQLVRGGLSPTTARTIHNILHRALRQAQLDGLVVRNPCDLVEPPRAVTVEASPSPQLPVRRSCGSATR
jgi:hypothetical protein